MMELSGRSSKELKEIAKSASLLAEDLQKKQPTLELALAAGIEDRSYKTIRCGGVISYRGEAIITMDDGSRWKAIGHGPRGGPDYISHQGYIEFIPLD